MPKNRLLHCQRKCCSGRRNRHMKFDLSERFSDFALFNQRIVCAFSSVSVIWCIWLEKWKWRPPFSLLQVHVSHFSPKNGRHGNDDRLLFKKWLPLLYDCRILFQFYPNHFIFPVTIYDRHGDGYGQKWPGAVTLGPQRSTFTSTFSNISHGTHIRARAFKFTDTVLWYRVHNVEFLQIFYCLNSGRKQLRKMSFRTFFLGDVKFLIFKMAQLSL